MNESVIYLIMFINLLQNKKQTQKYVNYKVNYTFEYLNCGLISKMISELNTGQKKVTVVTGYIESKNNLRYL